MITLCGKFSPLNGEFLVSKVKYFSTKNKVIIFNEILKTDFLIVIFL